MNPPGISVVRSLDQKVGRKVVSALAIRFAIYDVRDYKSLYAGMAELLPDGTGMVVTFSTLPEIFVSDIAAIWDSDPSKDKVLLQTLKTAELVQANAFKGKNHAAVSKKKMTLFFPDNMRCTNKLFNGEDPRPRQIKNNIRSHDVLIGTSPTGEESYATLYFVYWTLLIVEEKDRIVELAVPTDDEASELAALLGTATISMMKE